MRTADLSWPEPAERPNPEHEAGLRQAVLHCGDVTDSKCHGVGTKLAICLLGGELSSDASHRPEDGPRKAEGVSLLQSLSARGCAEAACGLALCYENGIGVAPDGIPPVYQLVRGSGGSALGLTPAATL